MEYDEINIEMPVDLAKDISKVSTEMGISEDEFITCSVAMMLKMAEDKTLDSVKDMINI